MRKTLAAAALLAAVLIVSAGAACAPGAKTQAVTEAATAPDFTVKDLQGRLGGLADEAKTAVVDVKGQVKPILDDMQYITSHSKEDFPLLIKNWQTRKPQEFMAARLWGFESPLPHHLPSPRPGPPAGPRA